MPASISEVGNSRNRSKYFILPSKTQQSFWTSGLGQAGQDSLWERSAPKPYSLLTKTFGGLCQQACNLLLKVPVEPGISQTLWPLALSTAFACSNCSLAAVVPFAISHMKSWKVSLLTDSQPGSSWPQCKCPQE